MLRFLMAILFFGFFATTVHAREFLLTIYNDGYACPGACDAHVVFNPIENGTRYAHSPDSTRDKPSKCTEKHDCVVCFNEEDANCMTVKYRGGGPKPGRFDFTLAFYQAYCSRTDIPEKLVEACAGQLETAHAHHYDTAINCFKTPDNPKCKPLMDAALAAQQADLPKRKDCLRLTQKVYNARQTDPKERRWDDCNYSEMLLGGPPSSRVHRLMPSSCPVGQLVGQWGYDCCTEDIRFAGPDHDECLRFFPH
jgi:hypothetical protein